MNDKKLKRIGINASMLDEHPTGVGVYTYNIINTLSSLYKSDCDRQLIVFTPSVTFLDKDVEVIKIPDLLKSSEYGKLAALCRFLWNTFCYHFIGNKFDLVLNPTTHGSFTLKNQIITIHDLISLRYENISSHQRFYFKYLLPFLVSRSILIITVSEATKKDVIKFLKCPSNKVKVVYNGYDKHNYNQTIQHELNIFKNYGVKNYFLAVGPTYPHKNFELLINTYHSFDEKFRIAHPLVIAGGKKIYLNHLKNLVKKLNLESKIHFLGYVPAAFMPCLYKEACLLVFPSLYEGFGFPLLEAMACGCPVIVSNTSSMPEVCGDAAIYFEPTSQESLSKAIYDVSHDENLRTSLIKKGLNQVKMFSWEKTGENLKEIIDRYT